MKAFVIAICCLVSTISPRENQTGSLDDLKWLAGEWQMSRKSGRLIEKWEITDGGALKGGSYLVNEAGERRMLETVWIKFENGAYWYIPTVPDQNDAKPVSFQITDHSTKGFVAENPDHDFPKRISYELINTDSLHAWTDDGANPPGKRSDFYYSRIKSE